MAFPDQPADGAILAFYSPAQAAAAPPAPARP